MSLNKTLDRLFDEIRREAKRNPEFADRLDAVLRLHDSRRDVADEVVEEVARDAPVPSAPSAPSRQRKKASPAQEKSAGGATALQEAPTLNPTGLYKREGEDALTAALATLDHAALRALVTEHNLDPSGETEAMSEAELAAHVIAQAKRRAERDDKMFDY
jgi:hypothetical protein